LGGYLKNYILRIYQYKENNPGRFVGVVEEPEKKTKKAFTNIDELWDILNPGHQKENEDRDESHTKIIERRRHHRSETSSFGEYSLDSFSEKNISSGVIANTSKSGICICTPGMLNTGDNILIKSDLHAAVQKATVRWCMQDINLQYRAGIEFLSIEN
jgi:hypothetical protein